MSPAIGRSPRIGVAVAATVMALTSCRFAGVDTLPLPGTVGTGAGSYSVQVELVDIGNLRPNAQVRVGDVPVGTVTALSTRDWHAVATVQLGAAVQMPANATATVGQNSLLGASYLEITPATGEQPTGSLAAGDIIPLARTNAYPTTEQVLAAASVILNGGGLNQLETITKELRRALGGENGAVKDLIPQLETFVAGLDAQRDDIVDTLDGLNQLSTTLAGQTQVIGNALEQLGPALQVLERERTDMTGTLVSLDRLGSTASSIIDASQQDLVANLNDLEPVLRSLADANKSLVDSLGLALSVPFPVATVPNACRGDYCNISLTIDLTLNKLDASWLSGTPLQGSLYAVQNMLSGSAPGTAGEAENPLLAPLGSGSSAGPAMPPSGNEPSAPGDSPTSGDLSPTPTPQPEPLPDEGVVGRILGGGQ
ncbi:MCE family protein [Pseudonocardia sp. T1-2H]|uniref:MCE family protein n=1 Tax=Pseudonocardia sp. T1-2H TaxID=3128899 RepID=UPI003100B103